MESFVHARNAQLKLDVLASPVGIMTVGEARIPISIGILRLPVPKVSAHRF